MSKTAVDIIGGVIFIVMGLWFSIYHKFVGASAAKTQQKFWELFHSRIEFSEATIKGFQIGFLVGGIFFIIFGLLTVLQIIRFR